VLLVEVRPLHRSVDVAAAYLHEAPHAGDLIAERAA
jgi:hypothetical protein